MIEQISLEIELLKSGKYQLVEKTEVFEEVDIVVIGVFDDIYTAQREKERRLGLVEWKNTNFRQEIG